MRRPGVVMWTACVASLAFCASPCARADDNDPAPTVEQIIAKNAAARGGLKAWRKINTMIWAGHIQSARAPAHDMPFLLEMKRPNKTHFEIKAGGAAATRIFDGEHGWTVRLARNGRPVLIPYSAEELRSAKDAYGLDGPLLDYKAKGIKLSLDGTDRIEGRKAYRLNVMLPSGTAYPLWVDAGTFLEVKYDRQARTPFGQPATVSVFYRDYQTVNGLKLPFMLETRTGPAGLHEHGPAAADVSDKLVIDKIVLNPPLGALAFSKPALFRRRNAVSVDARPERSPHFPSTRFPTLSRPPFPARGMDR